jgi:hypothetical protein
MFGKKEEQDLADEAAVKKDFQRLQALPIEQVAAEVMTRTFGPSGPAVDGEIRFDMVADGFLPASIPKEIYRLKDAPVSGHGFEAYWQLKALVREGVRSSSGRASCSSSPPAFPLSRSTAQLAWASTR